MEQPVNTGPGNDPADSERRASQPQQTPNNPPRPPRRRRRVGIWWIAVCGIAALIVGGLALALPLLKSPNQVAAEAQPPRAEPVTAGVEKRALTTQVVMRGLVAAGPSFPLKPSDALLKAAPVVTRTPIGNDAVFKVGDVILEVNGQPIIAMNWPFPAYRDILPNDRGPDVEQLQNTLTKLGYQTSRNSLFDALTQAGLSRLYADLGYQAPDPSRNSTGDSGAASAPGAIYLPAANVAVVPKESNRLTHRGVDVGMKISAQDLVLMSLDGESNIVVASTSPERAGTLKVGNKAELASPTGGEIFPLTVKSVDSKSTEVEGLGAGVRIELGFSDTSKIEPVGALGSTQKVVITTGGDTSPVLVVPITAVYSNPDGTSFVTPASDREDRIEVSIGTNVDGWVQVIPKDAARLSEGDKVIVGTSID